jgi:hypothetical protein
LICYHALLKFFCRVLVSGLFVSSIVCPFYLSTLLFLSTSPICLSLSKIV